MPNAREENRRPRSDAAGTHPNGGGWKDGFPYPDEPSWCIDSPTCRGDHRGKTWGTVATGGLPPVVDSIEPPPYNTVCVAARFPESDGLPRGVALFGAQHGEDWEVELTPDEAVAVAKALEAAVDKVMAP